jgi:broad specificity phosphatase PhoE
MPALYVIRHAQPETSGLLTGQTDPELSLAELEQASRLNKLKGIVYSSPLRRALHTALYLSPKPVILPGLAEITYGEWMGSAGLKSNRDGLGSHTVSSQPGRR